MTRGPFRGQCKRRWVKLWFEGETETVEPSTAVNLRMVDIAGFEIAEKVGGDSGLGRLGLEDLNKSLPSKSAGVHAIERSEETYTNSSCGRSPFWTLTHLTLRFGRSMRMFPEACFFLFPKRTAVWLVPLLSGEQQYKH